VPQRSDAQASGIGILPHQADPPAQPKAKARWEEGAVSTKTQKKATARRLISVLLFWRSPGSLGLLNEILR
jgi:hypothetical protein